MPRRLARFGLVGASGVVVNMGLLVALTDGFGVPYALASLFAIEASILSNFALNNAWTWSDRRAASFVQRLIKYHAVAGITALAVNWCLLVVLTLYLRVDYRISNLIGIAAGVAVNFLLNHVWTFGVRGADEPGISSTAEPPISRTAESLREVSRPRSSANRLLWSTVVVVLILTAIRIYFAANAELLPEEAYYWTYWQHPSLGYFDHPPMVAWVVALGTLVFGNTELGVRFGTILLSLGSSVLVFRLSRLWFGRRRACWAVLLFSLLPIFICTGVLAFPDAPLIFFWLLTMLAFSKAIGAAAGNDGPSHPSGRQATFYWLLTGLAFGGALLSKYTAVMLAPSLGLFLLLSPTRRGWLLRPQPWLALAAGLLVFAPVLVWNAQHEWASFLFQSTRTAGQRSAPVKNVFEFWLLQLLILGPIPLVVFGAVALRGVRRRWMKGGDVWNLSLSLFLPLFAIFVLASFKTEVHINWTAPAFLSLVIGAAAIFQEGIETRLRLAARYWRVAGWCVVVFAVGAAGLGVSTRVFGIPKSLTPSRMAGWRQLATNVSAAKAELERITGQEAFVLGTDRYNMAAELGFYMRDPGNCVNSFALGKQGLGFHYWTDLDALENRPAVAVLTKPDERTLAELHDHFDKVGHPVRFDIPLGGRTRTMWLVDCRRYHAATLTHGDSAAMRNDRSADFQSAVSPNCMRRSIDKYERLRTASPRYSRLKISATNARHFQSSHDGGRAPAAKAKSKKSGHSRSYARELCS